MYMIGLRSFWGDTWASIATYFSWHHPTGGTSCHLLCPTLTIQHLWANMIWPLDPFTCGPCSSTFQLFLMRAEYLESRLWAKAWVVQISTDIRGWSPKCHIPWKWCPLCRVKPARKSHLPKIYPLHFRGSSERPTWWDVKFHATTT